jgi:hypothetical protein
MYSHIRMLAFGGRRRLCLGVGRQFLLLNLVSRAGGSEEKGPAGGGGRRDGGAAGQSARRGAPERRGQRRGATARPASKDGPAGHLDEVAPPRFILGVAERATEAFVPLAEATGARAWPSGRGRGSRRGGEGRELGEGPAGSSPCGLQRCVRQPFGRFAPCRVARLRRDRTQRFGRCGWWWCRVGPSASWSERALSPWPALLGQAVVWGLRVSSRPAGP